MKPRVARTRAGGEWTESRYFQFIRSTLRRASLRWPPITQVLLASRRPNESTNKRLKWEFQCAACSGWFPRKGVQVDHLIECGSLKCFDDLPRFVETLYCEQDNLYVLCSYCHENKEEILKKARNE